MSQKNKNIEAIIDFLTIAIPIIFLANSGPFWGAVAGGLLGRRWTQKDSENNSSDAKKELARNTLIGMMAGGIIGTGHVMQDTLKYYKTPLKDQLGGEKMVIRAEPIPFQKSFTLPGKKVALIAVTEGIVPQKSSNTISGRSLRA